MFSTYSAQRQYAAVSVDAKVLTADPHRLISLLFNGAIEALQQAMACIDARLPEQEQRLAQRAISIVTEGLRISLDRTHGGDLANNLDALYEYITRRIFEAAKTHDRHIYEESTRLLQELLSAWEEIAPSKRGTAPNRIVAA